MDATKRGIARVTGAPHRLGSLTQPVEQRSDEGDADVGLPGRLPHRADRARDHKRESATEHEVEWRTRSCADHIDGDVLLMPGGEEPCDYTAPPATPCRTLWR